MDFLQVYINFILIATGTILQNFEGLQIWSIWQGPSINYLTSYVAFSLLMTFFVIIVALFNLLTAFYLSNAAGFLSLLLWLAPGAISMLIGEPIIMLSGPSTYIIGSGAVGTGLGNFFDVIIITIISWSLFTVITVFFKTTQRYKHIYDVVWYSLALSAVFFFAHEIYMQNLKSSMNTDFTVLKNGYVTLSDQFSNTQQLCKEINTQNKGFNSFCEWVDSTKNYIDFKTEILTDTALYHDDIVTMDNIFSTRKFLPTQQEEIEYINKINRTVCKSNEFSHLCSRIDYTLIVNSDDFRRLYLLSPDTIVTKMNDVDKIFKKRYEENSQLDSYNNYRWVYFLFFAFVIGGKIAISTKDLFYSKENRDNLYVKIIFRKVLHFFKSLLLIIARRLKTTTLTFIAKSMELLCSSNKLNM